VMARDLGCDSCEPCGWDEDCECGGEGGEEDANPKDRLTKCPPTACDRDNWVVHARRMQGLSEQSRGLGVMCFTMLLLILCLVSFMFCQECLFVILVLSACMCPFFHPLNAPLWLAIVLLTIGGWSFTTGALSVSWKSK